MPHILGPAVYFKNKEITVPEDIGSVDVTVIRKGDISREGVVRVTSLTDEVPGSAQGCSVTYHTICFKIIIFETMFVSIF